MSQASSELTTRDVLQQVNRRLEMIEGDRRSLQEAIDLKLAAQDARADVRIRWTIGVIVMSWMSTMGTILFRLGPPTP